MRSILVASTILCVTLSGKAFSAQGLTPAPAAPQIWESCEQMHDDYLRRFESAAGFGMSRMIRPVMLDRDGVLDGGRGRYKIEGLELMGRLQFDAPSVYVPVSHDANLRATFNSREPNNFEKTALAAMRGGKELAMRGDDGTGTLGCVGAVRAKETCLRCHAGRKAGDLLGAFTYRLRRISRN